ncbi:zinc finger TRAF-type-containing protein 1 homolog [Anabrus simplex]|uniref:zinc finger TRAF-type-containing protein 1 homolog n=1 Tax=Anabrus simplex TaxID=316456 RepID=UPI0035A3BAF6
MAQSEPLRSSAGETSKVYNDDDDHNAQQFVEPAIKRPRFFSPPNIRNERLERRLGTILCCTVCWDLPKGAVYQCANGHLMCVGCFTHLLADSKLRDETSTCPSCRVEISRSSVWRNLAVEKASNELPCTCKFCHREFPRCSIQNHEQSLCEERIVRCKYNRIGCSWSGRDKEVLLHESNCEHSRRSGFDILTSLQIIDSCREKEMKSFENIIDLLSYEHIMINDLQFKPFRTEEVIHRLFYETRRFTAFNKQWALTAQISSSHQDPAQSYDREIIYQLTLKSKTVSPLHVSYVVLRGPFGDMKVNPELYSFEFTDQDYDSPYNPLPLEDGEECNRLLAEKYINFRFIMFLAPS